MKIMGLHFSGLLLGSLLQPWPNACKFIVTVNADFIVRANRSDTRLRTIIDENVSTLDGFWPWLIVRLRRPRYKIEKISGSDLIFYFAEKCIKESRTLLIVGGSAQAAAAAINIRSGFKIAAGWDSPFEPYPMSESYISEFQSKIRNLKPMVVVICLGSPKQEYFIEDQLDFMSDHGVRFAYGGGGTADMVAGKLRRAPVLVQNAGLESLWRLINEPTYTRLKRLMNSICFLQYCLK